MRWFLFRTFVVLWAALGCAGVGVIVGWWWLDRELDRFPGGTAPAVRTIDRASPDEPSGCAAPPTTMDRFSRMFERARGSDLPSFVASVLRCAGTEHQRDAFVAMLASAWRGGDAIAGRALETVAASHCAALTAIAGTAPQHRTATTRACADIAMGFADPAHPEEDAVRARTLSFAQRLALVAAGVADPATRTAFCEDAEWLPADAHDRIAAVRPDLPTLIERTCATQNDRSDP